MTRKEEIEQAANNYKNQFPDGFIKEYVYIDGAEWADTTMIDKVCKFLKKLVYQEYPGGPLVRQIDDEQLEELKEEMKGE